MEKIQAGKIGFWKVKKWLADISFESWKVDLSLRYGLDFNVWIGSWGGKERNRMGWNGIIEFGIFCIL